MLLGIGSRWGFVIGLATQPFWFYTSFRHRQWGIHCQYLLCLCLGDGCLPKLLRSDRSTGSALPRSPSRKLFSLISAISARAAGSPLSGAAAAVLSSATAPAWSRPCPRAFCRTKSSGCLSASTAPASPPLLIRARQRRCPGRHLYPTSRDVALRRADVFLGGQSYRGKFGLGLRQHGPQRDGEGRTGRSR
jgi:hypothetical protein